MSKQKAVKITTAHIEEFDFDFAKGAGGSVQGWRDKQEDAHIIAPNIKEGISLFCVFDGHGGYSVSKFCEAHFQEELLKQATFIDGSDYPKALTEACLIMDRRLRTPEGLEEIYKTHNGKESNVDWQPLIDNPHDKAQEMREARPDAGTTANIALFVKNKVYLANVGDSRTVICEDHKPKDLSIDHKPSNKAEVERVQKAGGFIINGRVNMKLTLTRAIGDLMYKNSQKSNKEEDQVIIAVPEITEYEVDKAKNPFMIMGCDGIWEHEDASKNNIDRVKAYIGEKSAKTIIDDHIFQKLMARKESDLEGTDNMTCIIIQFK